MKGSITLRISSGVKEVEATAAGREGITAVPFSSAFRFFVKSIATERGEKETLQSVGVEDKVIKAGFQNQIKLGILGQVHALRV